MRTSSLITISIPPTLVAESAKVAKKNNMTRSELVRAALRHYLEEIRLERVARLADGELVAGKARVLPRGGLAELMRR